jgi:hypothetical protein
LYKVLFFHVESPCDDCFRGTIELFVI